MNWVWSEWYVDLPVCSQNADVVVAESPNCRSAAFAGVVVTYSSRSSMPLWLMSPLRTWFGDRGLQQVVAVVGDVADLDRRVLEDLVLKGEVPLPVVRRTSCRPRVRVRVRRGSTRSSLRTVRLASRVRGCR